MSTFKLGSLLVRTLAKPVASSIKTATKQSPVFRKACIGIAQKIKPRVLPHFQGLHRTEINLKMMFLGYKREAVRPLNDTKAIEAGANFLSEAFIFLVAGSIIVFENFRSRWAAQDRRDYVNDQLDSLTEESKALRLEVEGWKGQVEGLKGELASLVKALEGEKRPHGIENSKHGSLKGEDSSSLQSSVPKVSSVNKSPSPPPTVPL
ncbi:MAG: optic atrophy 3 protein-domain-containing protein [Piptocephalis tieghemiana]|nr:MAG: optic atrophy 3 protein-domain-containing protein [Piptocephalis tieghemiana]